MALSGSGRPITDQEILKWANSTVQKGKQGAKTIRSFKDPSITTGLFILDLLEALRPGIVDPALIINVRDNGSYEDRRQNGETVFPLPLLPASDLDSCRADMRLIQAKLAISIARKMNALIFLVPEDIVDVRPRLVCFFTFL